MRVEQIMSRQLSTCAPNDSLEYAASLMWNGDCGCLPVTMGNGTLQVCGIITDRDICMAALFQGRPLHDLRVADAMSKTVEVCKASDSVTEAERKMGTERIRRLPVLDDTGALVGILSMADIVREAARVQKSQRPGIACGEVTTTLATICAPRRPVLLAA